MHHKAWIHIGIAQPLRIVNTHAHVHVYALLITYPVSHLSLS